MTISTPHSVRSRRGVTLPELLAVFLIVGIVTALAVPKLDFSRFRADSSMRAVGTRFAAAQREAVARQHDVIVSFDTVARTLRIHWDTDNDHVEDSGEKTSVMILDDGIVFGRPSGATARAFGSNATNFQTINGRPALVFHRNGAASEAGGFYITTMRAMKTGANRPNDTRAIEFERSTGRAEWYRFRGSAWVRGF